MAEAILFNIAGGIISKLASPAIQETKLWWAVQEELDKLRTTVSTIQAVLLDAEEKYSQSHEVRVWVESLKEAFYDADDLLDEFSTDVLLKQMMTSNKMVKELWGELSIISIVGIGGLGKTTLAQLAYNDETVKSNFELKILFPKDYKIKIPYLVRLWIAQGFIKSSNSEQSLQDIGLEYFKDLLWRSFFQEVEENAMGNLWSCKMHDLMHDLAKQVAGDETILLNSDAKCVQKITRHLSINVEVESWQKFSSCLLNVSKVRTFTSFSWSKTHDIKVECDEIFSKLSHVRALDLCDLGIKKVPHSIDKLKHIRFLDLSHNRGIEILPDSIIKLQNLQTLNLINCERLKHLPKHIKKLVNLQQLWLDGCVSLTHMPRGIGQLTALENLSAFMVAKDMGVSKRSGGLGELRDLNKLGGNLRS
ncbi:hypothetical protein GH714_016123 [Hevea brasiliensis]|uniref:Rx N-terminal domain-containing protein n=1 Tax=Hevea brasiliensis TaxID=3981 RepID=A0A6A6N055_HEVBR|nr:hypothetical protein GH714_016123 [Hevea brasiliensis]